MATLSPRTTKGESPQGLWPQNTARMPASARKDSTTVSSGVGMPPCNKDSTTTERWKQAGELVNVRRPSPPRTRPGSQNIRFLKSCNPNCRSSFIASTHRSKVVSGGMSTPPHTASGAGCKYRMSGVGTHLIASLGIPPCTKRQSPMITSRLLSFRYSHTGPASLETDPRKLSTTSSSSTSLPPPSKASSSRRNSKAPVAVMVWSRIHRNRFARVLAPSPGVDAERLSKNSRKETWGGARG
mmetsp:Transcript_66784/g.148291  ORF Transcript_66784/g.148291 Transcript_66784/m.148291 type:complete len:241 (-) Transcript_66784:42-764(-)